MKFTNLKETKETLIQHIETINDEAFLKALQVMAESKMEKQETQLSEVDHQKLQVEQELFTKCEMFTVEEIRNDPDEWYQGE